MTWPSRSRRGVALIAALGIIILLAALLCGAVAASTLSNRASRLVERDATLEADADYALNTVLADYVAEGLAGLPLGQVRVFAVPPPDSNLASASVAVTRLPRGTLWLVADVTSTSGDAGHRRTNLVARFPELAAIPRGALTARGNVSLARTTFATDSTGDADCAHLRAADVIVTSGATITSDTAVSRLVLARAADSSTYLSSPRQEALVDSAAAHPASRIVHVHGDTTIAGGAFGGVLVADGDITITGPFVATGLLVARGAIHATAGGFSLVGGAMAFGASTSMELANSTITYSPCNIADALRHAGAPSRVHERSWAELF